MQGTPAGDGAPLRFGLQKTTLLDYPGEVAAAVFTPGCNLRCPYCHNPDLVKPPYPDDLIGLEELDAFLTQRARILGGICITGGEPLLHPRLDELIDLIRRHRLKIKLDSNGTLPERLEELLTQKLLDYVAMDIKTAPKLYGRLLDTAPRQKHRDHKELQTARGRALGEKVPASIELLRRFGLPYELRTTVAPGIFAVEEMREILPLLPGARRYVIRPFRGGNTPTLDPGFASLPSPKEEEMQELCALALQSGVPCRRQAV
jgi:pyruvate formate lyase activating enzyme